ncbi:hypothetical protein EWM64_g6798 [Hericium alpestre]|uniref:Peptidase C14 caspase domain-containing protein n=1 Tax=Hericium alpestre TaxID=135208 RepID=A0A4Y9ZT54_9AGAM|nr:hypothetical protein EWM64_g6798 [Hericium alpestre]
MPLPKPTPLKAINSFLDPPPLPWEGRRRALLIGINYRYEKCDKYPPLKGPSNDIKKMKQLLISQYQFGDHEIVIMTDDDEKMSGTDLWPTCDNIVKQIEVLVHDAEPHDFFIFHFAGHCSQQEAVDDPTEVDGLNEVLIGCDFRGLVDDRDASTWQNAKSRYASMKIKMMAIVRFSRAARKQKSRRAKHLFTCGEQCQHTLHGDAVVVSLSACLDHQVTWEDRRDQGAAMTDTLIKILEKDPAITLRDVEQQLRFYF